MKRLILLSSSTIGRKVIAAVTGAGLFLFLLGHVAGNLKVFTGGEFKKGADASAPAIDEYAEFLRTMGHPILPDMMGLWLARLGLLACLIIHLVVVFQLAVQSQKARPIKYAVSKKAAATPAALYMMFSGIALLAFVLFHLLHFTVGSLPIGKFEHGMVYYNLYHSFTNPLIALVYVGAMVILGFHLFHGVWSFFQTMGLDNPDRNELLRKAAIGITAAVVIGFSMVPIAFVIRGMSKPVPYEHKETEKKQASEEIVSDVKKVSAID